MALTVVWIQASEPLLRGIPYFRDDPTKKYVDEGVLTGFVFKDRHHCPSVHMASCANLIELVEEQPKRFGFAVITTGDVRSNGLGEVVHNPTNEHNSHAMVIPPTGKDINNKSQMRIWRSDLVNLVWDLIFIPERVEQLR